MKKKEYSILLIIENPKERTNLGSRLRTQNFSVEAANGGFHAIHLVEKKAYDLIMIIEDMHDMSGFEILSLIRNVRPMGKHPILYMSKSTSQEDLMHAMELGANNYLVYSQNFQSIIEAINKLIPDRN